MANICDNRFYFCCEHNSEKYINNFKELQNNAYNTFDFEVIDSDEDFCSIEGYFESKWNFPIDTIHKYLKLDKDDDCYFRCLSEEYGNGYVAMNIYRDGEWWEEQTFNI